MNSFDFSRVTNVSLENIGGGSILIIDTESLQCDPDFITCYEKETYRLLLPNTLYSVADTTKQSFDLVRMDKANKGDITIWFNTDYQKVIFRHIHRAQDVFDFVNPDVVFDEFTPIYADDYWVPQVIINTSKISKPFGPRDFKEDSYLINNGHAITSKDLYCVYDDYDYGYGSYRLLVDQSKERDCDSYNLTHFFYRDLAVLEGAVYSAQEIFDKYIFTM